MINNPYLLYLKFKSPVNSKEIIQLLKQNGFAESKDKEKQKTGLFKSHFYDKLTAAGLLYANFNLAGNDENCTMLSLSFEKDSAPEIIDDLFDLLKAFDKALNFDLLDLELRNTFYEELQAEGKVDKFLVGLPKAEQAIVEKKSYIPIDIEVFKANEFEVLSRRTILTGEKEEMVTPSIEEDELPESSETPKAPKGMLGKFFKWINRK